MDRRLSAVVLLCGGLTPSPLAAATGCSVLDLLVADEETLFDRWMAALQRLDGAAAEMRVIVAAGGAGPAPLLDGAGARPRAELIHPTRDFRGAAGVVRDVAAALPDEALLLVAEAARWADFDLGDVLDRHLASGYDVSVLVNPDRSPAGVYLLRRELLGLVQIEGYMDLKEQWLARVTSAGHRVGVLSGGRGGAKPIRTREQLLDAARAAAGGNGSSASLRFSRAAAHAGRGTFRCVSPRSIVAEDAVIIDSIVMPGARVEAGGVVARSIVCAGACVHAGESLVDAVLPAAHRNGQESTDHSAKREPEP